MPNQPYVDQIGPYKVLEEIGRGGMATVFRVHNPEGQEYALKLLHYGSSQDPRWGTRFQREFRLLSRLRHPHLIEVHDYGEDHDQAYYVMNYIEGMTLWGFYREKLRNLPIIERLRWLLPLTGQVISALDYIHRHRVVHQDIKPANILLSADSQTAYLADFGLAREVKGTFQYTHAGFVGTLGYAAPEIVERARLDGRADIYSLGVVLYTVMADCRPIQVEGRPLEQVVRAVLYEEPAPLNDIVEGMPADVAAVVHRCIQKDPNARFRSTRELWQEIFPIITGFQQQATVHLPVPVLPEQEAAPLSQPWMESQLIGRREEMSLCQLRLERLMKQRESSSCIFYGIPGIGKSYLMEELTRIARRFTPNTFTIRLRNQARPFGSLAELLRQLLRDRDPQEYVGDAYNQLAFYLPNLPHSVQTAQNHLPPLVDPVEDVARRLNTFLEQILSPEGQVCLIDDLHNADIASQEIMTHWIAQSLANTSHPLCLLASFSYAPGGVSPSFRLDDHEQVDSLHLLPFSEEEEQDYMEQLLGRPPSDHEYQPIRLVSRGIPLRTYELIHQNDLLHKLQSKSEEVGIPGLYNTSEIEPEDEPPTRNVTPSAFEEIPDQDIIEAGEATALRPILSELSTLSHAAKISNNALAEMTQKAPAFQQEKLSPPPGGLQAPKSSKPESTDPQLTPVPPSVESPSNETQRAPYPDSRKLRPPANFLSPPIDDDDDESGESTVLAHAPLELLPLPSGPLPHTLDVDKAQALALQADIAEMEVDEHTGEQDFGEATDLYQPALHGNIEHTLQSRKSTPNTPGINIDPLQAVPLAEQPEETTRLQMSPFAEVTANTEQEATQRAKAPTPRTVTMETDDEVALDSQLQTIALRENVDVGDVTILHSAPTQLRANPPSFDIAPKPPTEVADSETMIGATPPNLEDLGESTALVAPLSELDSESTMLVSPLSLPVTEVRSDDDDDDDEEPTAFFRSIDIAQELLQKKSETPIPSQPQSAHDPTPKSFTESSEELVLIPLLQRRLDMLGPERQVPLAYATFLADAFTVHELCTAAELPPEEAMDLINLSLSLRILEIHPDDTDEQYAFLYPIFRRLLTAELPPNEWRSYSNRAALAMSLHREEYHRKNSASLLAMRYSDAEQPVESLRWQLFSFKQTLHTQLPEAQLESLLQLFKLLQHWAKQGASQTMFQALPSLFQELAGAPSGMWEHVCYRLLWVGCLYALHLPQQARASTPQAQNAVRSLMQQQAQTDSSQISILYKRLHPLLQFAHLDFVSQA